MLGRQTVPESVCFFVGAWHRFLASGALVAFAKPRRPGRWTPECDRRAGRVGVIARVAKRSCRFR